MKTMRIIGPTAVLLLVGGMLAGNAQARVLDQNRGAQQQPNPGKGHDKSQGHDKGQGRDNGKGHDNGKGNSQQAQAPQDRAQPPQARGQARALQAQQQAVALRAAGIAVSLAAPEREALDGFPALQHRMHLGPEAE